MDCNTFLMIGRPGSGKGTQAKLLAQKIGAKIFSSGDEFRALAAGSSYLGRRIKAGIEGGELMPHWLASFIYEKEVFTTEPEEKLVFEGACRTEPEAALFHEISLWLPRPYSAVYLNVPEEEVWQRLLKRAGLEGRKDDREAAIRTRFDEYTKKNEAVIGAFRTRGTLVEVNGDQSIEAVHADVLKALNLA